MLVAVCCCSAAGCLAGLLVVAAAADLDLHSKNKKLFQQTQDNKRELYDSCGKVKAADLQGVAHVSEWKQVRPYPTLQKQQYCQPGRGPRNTGQQARKEQQQDCLISIFHGQSVAAKAKQNAFECQTRTAVLLLGNGPGS